MFDRLLSSPGPGRSRAARLTLPISSAIHAALLGALLGASCLAVGSIQPPTIVSVLILPPPPSARIVAPPPPPGGAAGKPRIEERKILPPEELPDMIQPTEIPDKAPTEAPESGARVEAGETGGEIGGVPGGKVGGTPGGDPNGVFEGSLDGDPDGVPGGLGIAPGGDEPIRLMGDIRPPERILKIEPLYPDLARRSRAEGKVILEIVVGRGGDVEGIEVLKSHPLFDEAAIEAVRQWKYAPALQSGRPVKVYMTVVVDFRLK
jgi:protein TonB